MRKYALVISGQVRYFRMTLPLLLSRLVNFKDCDVYLSTSDLTHYVSKEGTYARPVDPKELDEICSIIGRDHISQIHVEDEHERQLNSAEIKNIETRMGDKNKFTYAGQIWQWFKARHAVHMIEYIMGIDKKKYDAVIYTRMDCTILEDINIEDYDLSVLHGAHDILCFGNYDIMKIFMSTIETYGKWHEETSCCYCSEKQLYRHLQSHSLIEYPIKEGSFPIILARHGYVDVLGHIDPKLKEDFDRRQKELT